MFPATGTNSRVAPVLAIKTELESKALRYNNVHKVWGSVTLTALAQPELSVSVPVDFVIAIDISASMRVDSKLAFVQATIEYLLSKLDALHTFSLIVFNHEVVILAELFPCTESNKSTILRVVHGLKASGPTNISEALFTGAKILASRPQGNRVSTLMLFTDGLSNRGLSTPETVQSLEKMRLPPGCIFNTFGFGSDHDSKLLHSIAQKAQGVYYFVEKKEDIPSTFGECVAGLLATRAHQITVALRCHEGSRLVTLATPFAVTDRVTAKEYDVNMELMYRAESKTIIFRLSLKQLEKPTSAHVLMHVDVSFVNALSGQREMVTSGSIVVSRPAMTLLERVPLQLDQHLNRYTAATAISEAIELAKKYQYAQAQQKLMTAVEKIQKSISSEEDYCVDLVSDLNDCIQHMTSTELFETKGLHMAHAYASMYFMERSSGVTRRLRDSKNAPVRHIGYGYVTQDQETEAQNALDLTRRYVNSYLADIEAC